ncbi:MAG: DUF4292 domain-containing protein [Candidatus Latescibacteria bacterium]|jgi:outer membrane biogenesis lipoprotein LolB|nr:DUF4292 domain-containing protein [Candidatus Latescibacterota bacterium]
MRHTLGPRGLALLAVLILLPACAAHRHLPAVGPLPRAADLLLTVCGRADSLRDLEARARISLKIDGVRERALAFLRYKSPGRLKMDVTGPLGTGVLHALSSDDSLELYLPRQNRYLQGLPDEVLHRVTGVNLEYYEARRAILGLPALSLLDLPRITRYEALGDTLVLEVRGPIWNRSLRFDRRAAVLWSEEVSTPEGDLLSSRHLSDYRNEGGALLPRRIEIRQGQDRIEIRILKRQVNVGLSDGEFWLNVPSDVVHLAP